MSMANQNEPTVSILDPAPGYALAVDERPEGQQQLSLDFDT